MSFDNTKVGELQGTALTQCPQVKGKSSVKYVEIDGAPTDNNAHAVQAGLRQRAVEAGRLDEGRRPANGNWDDPQAGVMFASMLQQATRTSRRVMVANDTYGRRRHHRPEEAEL